MAQRATEASFLPATASASPGPLNIGQTILRTFVHHCWKILVIWVVLTAGLAYMIQVKIEPLYETYSQLQVEPPSQDLFGLGLSSEQPFAPFLQTQVQLLTSPSVLSPTLLNPKVPATSLLRDAEDMESELRKRLQVGVIPGTFIVRVGMYTPHPEEAALIINEVVKEYLKVARTWSSKKNETQIASLTAYNAELTAKFDAVKNDWLELAKNSNIDLVEPTPASAGGSSLPVAMPSKISLDHYRQVREQQFQITMELIQAEAMLSNRQAESDARSAAANPELFQKKRIEEAFHRIPEVAALLPKIEQARHRVNDVSHLARFKSDPARASAERQLSTLTRRLNELWNQKRDDLALDVRAHGTGTADDDVRELTEQIAEMKIRKANYDKLLETKGKQDREQGTDAVKVALIREDLASLRLMKESVSKRIEQLLFDSRGEARINLLDPARDKGMLLGDSRKKYLMMTPVGVFAMVLGLFLFLELRSGRVSDLDEVSRRVPAEVYSLPSLPGTRRTSDQRALRSNEAQLHEFLQSLDHLRVSLWFDQEPTAEAGRCLAVTSAIGGEGKTTLASHLAVCCAKSGISTLVIDADMRRAALSRMFEVEESKGLSDVLKGDVSPEDALVPLNDGGFHLLPAGTPGQHPGWLFREQRIGQVLDRYRKMFDLVIIDTPPVLMVPDALSLGRWVDGVVLVIRYDQSRFALVDRARRRLTSAGIPILKTVVNGVKASRFGSGYVSGYNSAYGYGNGYGERTQPSKPPDSSSDGDGAGNRVVAAGPPGSTSV